MLVPLLVLALAPAVQPVDCGAQRTNRLVAEPEPLLCDEHWRCEGTLRIALSVCGADAVEVRRLELADRVRYDFEPGTSVARGQVWTLAVPVHATGPVTIIATLSSGHRLKAAITVKAPALEAARQRCRACSGTWGPMGLMGTVGCNCIARDAGRVCRTSSECEGACLFERFEVVRPASRGCRGETCWSTPALGRPIGRCSQRTRVFGCHASLDGPVDAPPVTLPARMALVCSC